MEIRGANSSCGGLRGTLPGAPGPERPLLILSGPAAERPPSLDAGQGRRPVTLIWGEPTAVWRDSEERDAHLTVAHTATQVDTRRGAVLAGAGQDRRGVLSPRGQETAAADGSAPSGPLGRVGVAWSQGCPAPTAASAVRDPHLAVPRAYGTVAIVSAWRCQSCLMLSPARVPSAPPSQVVMAMTAFTPEMGKGPEPSRRKPGRGFLPF